ncbi:MULTISPECIES: DUF3857 domain-containing protein [Niastella]|uniref:DUF3857 domain-containing protein n=1 Tax=Niastella soli TaxID=2821487 RepID=A0ABS3YV65_9BACT|nr:DUF3857 domain-containing protein [Niastella soli]MBO9201824.1 DUF3857 domain-containing protein [Niastella soli]
MKKCLSVLTAICAAWTLQAQISPYALLSIPETVKKDADIIKRLEEITFEVTDIDRSSLSVHQVITVMNEKGKRALHFAEFSDKFRILDAAEVKVFDASGKQINRYKQKDMITRGGFGDALVDDNMITYVEFPSATYPVTFEVNYNIRYKGNLFYPSFDIQDPDESVESSVFTAKVPKDLDLRYKEKNITLQPEIGELGNYKTYRWSVKNLPALKHEAGSVNPYPYVMLAPTRFKYDAFEGDLSTWKGFGAWCGSLWKGLDKFPADRVAFFNDLVKDAPNNYEKTRILYSYLQKNFRYVSIQLGIGGFRPFSADFTEKKKYGDCKALSNCMKAMLSAVGIKSYSAIINAGNNAMAMDPDFPAQISNHVILCVPMQKDTVWLECTSTIADFNVLGAFTENRNALLLTEEGGVLVSTPESKCADNVFKVHTVIDLQTDGSGSTHTNFTTTGEFKQTMKYYLDEKIDDQKEFIVNYLNFKQPDEFTFKQIENPAGFTTNLEMSYEKVHEFNAGNKLFISPRIYRFWSKTLPKSEDRKQDYYFSYPFERIDTTVFKLPAGASVEALPKPKELSCDLATYTTKYWYNETEKAVYSSAVLVLKKAKVPATSYAAIKKLFDDILMDDTQRIVIKKE